MYLCRGNRSVVARRLLGRSLLSLLVLGLGRGFWRKAFRFALAFLELILSLEVLAILKIAIPLVLRLLFTSRRRAGSGNRLSRLGGSLVKLSLLLQMSFRCCKAIARRFARVVARGLSFIY